VEVSPVNQEDLGGIVLDYKLNYKLRKCFKWNKPISSCAKNLIEILNE